MWTNALIDVLLVFYVIDCAFMGLVIMMQRSKQEGLGAAFGSGVMSDTFGAQTSNVLVKATVWATIIFFILSITLARLYSNREASEIKGSSVQQMLMNPVAPAKPANAPAVNPGTPTNSSGAPVVPTATPMNSSTAAPAPTPAAPAATPAPAPVAPAKPAAPATK